MSFVEISQTDQLPPATKSEPVYEVEVEGKIIKVNV